MRVLAIGCHPDDLEFECYGTLARHVKQGDDVIVCTITNGSMGDMVIPPKELAEIRIREATNAAKVIGAQEYICAGIEDLGIKPEDDEQQRRVTDIIRYAKPDYIICHGAIDFKDYHNDHNFAADLTYTASFNSSIPHYITKHPVHHVIPPLYFFEPTSTRSGFRPTDYVDITETIELKMEAIACHETQMKWLKEHVGNDPLSQVRARAIVHGRACRCLYAEPFQRCDQHLRMTASRLLP